jgi:hypothetical protein
LWASLSFVLLAVGLYVAVGRSISHVIMDRTDTDEKYGGEIRMSEFQVDFGAKDTVHNPIS